MSDKTISIESTYTPVEAKGILLSLLLGDKFSYEDAIDPDGKYYSLANQLGDYRVDLLRANIKMYLLNEQAVEEYKNEKAMADAEAQFQSEQEQEVSVDDE